MWVGERGTYLSVPVPSDLDIHTLKIVTTDSLVQQCLTYVGQLVVANVSRRNRVSIGTS